MHPVKAVPTRCNPFVHGEKPKKTHSSIKPIKTPKKPAGLGFFKKKNPGFFKPCFLLHWNATVFKFSRPVIFANLSGSRNKGHVKKNGFYRKPQNFSVLALGGCTYTPWLRLCLQVHSADDNLVSWLRDVVMKTLAKSDVGECCV